jgi:hypothetical protein
MESPLTAGDMWICRYAGEAKHFFKQLQICRGDALLSGCEKAVADKIESWACPPLLIGTDPVEVQRRHISNPAF